MKKYILYLFVFALGCALYFFTRGQKNETLVFYGFSENKEQELNFDYDVKVTEIMVNSGQYVKQGDPMLKVERTSNPLRFSEIQNEMALLELRKNANILEVQNEIKSLQSKQNQEINEIDNKIVALEANITRNKILLDVIEDMKFNADSTVKGSDHLKIEELKSQKKLVNQSKAVALKIKNDQVASIKAQFDLEWTTLQQSLDFYTTQEKNHLLRAPVNGIVGFINCNPGENYSSFSKLLSLYDPHPQMVKGYILESMITSIQIDDSVNVSSALDPTKAYKGIVTGFGTRIMEIPNRLSKIPELTMYGREVLITIPPKNNLLQKEKVRVQLLKSRKETSLGQKISNF